jgi:hypothetical protein
MQNLRAQYQQQDQPAEQHGQTEARSLGSQH